MLHFNGEEFFWNGLSVRELNIKELSCSERFEFLCAISSHDPMDLQWSSGRPSTSGLGEES